MSHPIARPPGSIDEGTGFAPVFSAASLAPVCQLNTLFLETLIESSRHPAWRGSSWEAALGQNLPDALPSIREELSRAPVSLVDIGLTDPKSRLLLSDNDMPAEAPPPFLRRGRAIDLAQLTLSLAWSLSRSDVVTTSIIFGVSRTQAKVLGALALHSLPKVSERLSSTLRPRWMTEPRIWERLSRLSKREIAAHLPPTRARILQRQFADLLPVTSARHLLRPSRL